MASPRTYWFTSANVQLFFPKEKSRKYRGVYIQSEKSAKSWQALIF